MAFRFQTSFNLWKLLLVMMLFNCISALVNVSSSAYWTKNATTVAGQANGTYGSSNNSLNYNIGICISKDDTLFIADALNNRIVVVPLNDTTAINIIRAGIGGDPNQFFLPKGVFTADTSIYVTYLLAVGVQRWLRNGTNPVLMPGTSSQGNSGYLFVDRYTNLYVSDSSNAIVVRFAPNSSSFVIVAGNGTSGSALNQLNGPYGIFVDDALTVYVADRNNHRIQMWSYGASSGITVAGTGEEGTDLTQLYFPSGFVVDLNGYMFIADTGNNRILRWSPNSTSGVCVVGCSMIAGNRPDQLNVPGYVALDSNGSIYVSDIQNNRVQKFQIVNNYSQMSSNVATTHHPTSAALGKSLSHLPFLYGAIFLYQVYC